MIKCCLVGKDIGGSFSPRIHTLIYERLRIEAEFCLEEMADIGCFKQLTCRYDAIYVTKPYKLNVRPYLDICEPNESVNLVYKNRGRLVGLSTDGNGFALALVRAFGRDTAGVKAALVGAGGAAYAIAPFLQKLCGEVAVYDRSAEKAEKLARLFGLKTAAAGYRPQLVVLAVTDSLGVSLPAGDEVNFVFDLNYGARARNPYGKGTFSDGLGMLVYQAILGDTVIFSRSLGPQQLDEMAADIEACLKKEMNL